MAVAREAVERVLAGVACPGGGTLISRDLVRALQIEGGTVRFVLEAANPDEARSLAPAHAAAESALKAVSYTHLDVYKRQAWTRTHGTCSNSGLSLHFSGFFSRQWGCSPAGKPLHGL